MKNDLIFILSLLFIALCSSMISAEETSAPDFITIYHPKAVNIFQPFTIHVEFLNIEIAKQYKYVQILGSGCTVPFEYQSGQKEYPYRLVKDKGSTLILYSGEESMDLPLSITKDGRIQSQSSCNIRLYEHSDYTSPNYTASKSLWDNMVIVEFPLEIRPYQLGIRGLPPGFVSSAGGSEESFKKDLKTAYKKETSSETIVIETDIIGLRTYEGAFLTYNDLFDIEKIGSHIGVNNAQNQKIKGQEDFESGDEKGFIYYGCTRLILGKEDTYGQTEEFQTKCYYNGILAKKIGPLKIYGYAETLTTLGSEQELISKEDEWKALMVSSLKNQFFESEGDNGFDLPEKKKEKEPVSGLKVSGTIKDGLSNPLPYAAVLLKIKDKTFEGVTDGNGQYEIIISDMEFKESETEIPVQFYLDLLYKRGGVDYFWIISPDLRTRQYSYASVVKHDTIKDFKDLELSIDLSAQLDPAVFGSPVGLNQMKHLSVIYFHSHESVDFMLTELKADIGHRLPIKVFVGNRDDKTLYSPEGEILISASDASISSTNRPDNREYHEWSHHLMYAVYDGWPEGGEKPGNKNHGGFFNPNTADSYIEGFAEFMAMAISENKGDTKPWLYAHFGSMEKDYKPWDGRGYDEEFAVASLLWDMYDSENEAGDRLTLTLGEMWDVMKVRRADFYEYYKAFKKSLPEKSQEIDELFKKHGFFIDTREGNKRLDPDEPWSCTKGNLSQCSFIDLSANASSLTYGEGLAIGTGTNYERPERTQAVMIPDAFLSVDDRSVDFFKVIITENGIGPSYEYTVKQADGKVYINPLPLGSDAEIMVIPLSTAYRSDKPFRITSREWNTLLSEKNEKGYLAGHDFAFQKTGKDEEFVYETFSDVLPNYDYKGDLGERSGYEIGKENEREGSQQGKYSLAMIAIIAIIVIAVLIVAFHPKIKRLMKG